MENKAQGPYMCPRGSCATILRHNSMSLLDGAPQQGHAHTQAKHTHRRVRRASGTHGYSWDGLEAWCVCVYIVRVWVRCEIMCVTSMSRQTDQRRWCQCWRYCVARGIVVLSHVALRGLNEET